MIDSSFDIIVGTILLIIVLFSFLKGFSKDFSSTLCWVSSLLISYKFSPILSHVFIGHVNPLLVGVASHAIIFISSIIIIYILISKLVRPLLDKIPSVINQSLGLFFGVFKAYIILSIMLAVLLNVSSSKIFNINQLNNEVTTGKVLSFVKNSKFYPILEFGALKLSSFLDDSLPGMIRSSQSIESIKKYNSQKKTISKKLLIKKDAEESGGYESNEIRKMERLIKVINSVNYKSDIDNNPDQSTIKKY